MILGNLNIPSINSITSRSSSIRAAFVKAVIPTIFPNDIEVREKLLNELYDLLPHTHRGSKCAYCTSKATEWDHFRSVIKNSKPSGYSTDIYNLVPSCGKCNQSKGSKEWNVWIKSEAALSPKTLKTPYLEEEIIPNLIKFEEWSNSKTYKLTEVEIAELEVYMSECEELIKSLYKYQEKAKAFQIKFQESANSKF